MDETEPLSVVNEASVWLFWSLCLEGEGTHLGETHSGTLLRWYNALIISVFFLLQIAVCLRVIFLWEKMPNAKWNT